MCNFLRSIGIQPIEWSQAVAATQTASPYVGQILNAAFSKAQVVIVLLTPDDEARLPQPYWGSNDPAYEKELTPQARPNVLFEAGMALGRHPDRTVLVELGTLKPFSDVGGRQVARMDGTNQKRQDLAQRLENAGCAVDLTSTDWHTAADFSTASQSLPEVSSLPQHQPNADTGAIPCTKTLPSRAPLLVPNGGSPTFSPLNKLWLMWGKPEQNLIIANHGNSPAFNVTAVLYGCESYIMQGTRDTSSQNEHWTCWQSQPVPANSSLIATFKGYPDFGVDPVN